LQIGPQEPHGQSSPHVTRSLGQIHTWQLINSEQCRNFQGISANSQTESEVSLSIQLDQSHEIQKETEGDFTNPNRILEAKFKLNS